MRILRSSLISLAVASWAGLANTAFVTFNDSEFVKDGTLNAPVFVINNLVSPTTSWTAKEFPFTITPPGEARIVEVILFASDSDIAHSSPTSTTGSATSASSAFSPPQSNMPRAPLGAEGPDMLGAALAVNVRQDLVSPPAPNSVSTVEAGDASSIAISVVDSGPAGGRVVLNLTQLLDRYASQDMYFKLVWDEAPGASYSRVFTVLSATAGSAKAQELAGQERYKSGGPRFTEQVGDTGQSNNNGGAAGGLGGTVPTATTVPPAASTSNPVVTTSNSAAPTAGPMSDPRPSSSHKGLSRGAIAGIAVAAVLIGLALLASLIFCLVRRRRREQRLADSPLSPGGGGGYGSRATPDLIAQKEAHATVGVEVAPHSPYSDDGVMAAHAAGLRPGSARQEEVPFTGYGNRSSVSRRSGGDDGGSLAGSQGGRVTPGRATPTAVRHLVEEGMTEDEIRRLEEEERELDQAIEQAGSSGGGGGRR